MPNLAMNHRSKRPASARIFFNHRGTAMQSVAVTAWLSGKDAFEVPHCYDGLKNKTKK
jgi:hypothetical protein